MKKILWALFLLIGTMSMNATNVSVDGVWFDGQHPVTYQVVGKVDPVVKMALQMFSSDMEQVTGMKPVAAKKATIRIVQGKGSDDGVPSDSDYSRFHNLNALAAEICSFYGEAKDTQKPLFLMLSPYFAHM